MVSDSGAKVLRCSRCSHTWIPRKDWVPQRCPRCRSIKWNEPCLNLKCLRCGYEWNPHGGIPKRCPGCGTHKWNVPVKVYVCKKCGNKWNARGSDVPKRCPVCSSRTWNQDVQGPAGRKTKTVEEKVCAAIIGSYKEGMSCTDIAIKWSLPYSVVYSTVKEIEFGKEIKV